MLSLFFVHANHRMCESLKKKFDVCLVMPPFAEINYSSLALSLLKNCLVRENISCIVEYVSMIFARRFGLKNTTMLTVLQVSHFVYFLKWSLQSSQA